MGTLRFYTYL